MHARAARPFGLLAVAMLSIAPPLSGITVAETEQTAVGPTRSPLQDTLARGEGSSTSSIVSQVQGPEQPPGTSYQISRDEIQRLAARGAEEVTALQAGVVLDRRTNDLYVRGGDASGLIYYVDGVPLQDAFSGISSARLSNAAIDEMSIITGGLGVDYGWGMSGATSITTPDGSSRFHGSAEAITDNFHGGQFDYNVYALSLNGPLLPNSDKLTFSVASERGWMGDRQPHANAGGLLPHNSSGTWMWNGKLRWKPTDRIVAGVGAVSSSADLKEYFRSYAFDLSHAPRTTDRNSAFWADVTHTLSQRTFYSVRGYWARQEEKTGDGVYFDNLWGYGRPNGNPLFDATHLFWSWDDMGLDPDSLAHGVTYQLHTPVVDTVIRVPLPSGDTIQKSFVASGDEGSVWNDYVRRDGSYIGGKADLVSQIGANNSLKFGAELQRHTLRYYHHYIPTRVYEGQPTGFQDADFYGFDALGSQNVNSGLNGAKHPLDFASYVQDRLDWQDLVMNAGVRVDYLDYASRRLRDPNNPLDPDNNLNRIKTDTTLTPQQRDSLAQEAGRLTESDLSKSKAIVRVSPRLGASFQIAAGSLLHFSFGRYYQRPDFGTLYSNFGYLEYKVKTGGYFAVMGNGNLKPTGMTSTELGVEQRITDFLSVGVTGFYKDISDLIGIVTQPASPNSFTTYRNVGDVTSKGLEFEAKMQRRWGISGQFSYTLQKADISFLPWLDPNNISWTGGGDAVRVIGPIGYDQRHKFTAIIDARVADKGGPRIGSVYPLERAGLNFVFTAASGFPYSPTIVYGNVFLSSSIPSPAGPYNSSRVPATYRLDLKADKAISLGGTTVDFYLWVLNVFDRVNVLDVYSGSGKPNDTGWLSTPDGQAYLGNFTGSEDASLMTGEQKYRFRENDPLNYDTPRQIRLGLQVSF